MKIINLDKFRRVQPVTLGGKEYEVYGLSVDDYLNQGVIQKVEQAKTPQEQVSAMLEALKRFTNIPIEVLRRQEWPVLTALIHVIQGIDPEDAADKQAKGGKGKTEKK